jgi:thioredoxin 1
MESQETIKHLAEDTFQSQTAKGTILVDFYADWCAPCRMMTPVLERVAQELKGKVVIAKLDIEQAQNTAASFQVTSIPTLILFNGGKEVGRLVGLKDAQSIKDFISSIT